MSGPILSFYGPSTSVCFPFILGASFSNIGTGPTYEEAQGVIDQLHLDHEFFMCELGERVNVLLKRPNG
mgnify:CR=1 FL=1